MEGIQGKSSVTPAINQDISLGIAHRDLPSNAELGSQKLDQAALDKPKQKKNRYKSRKQYATIAPPSRKHKIGSLALPTNQMK